MRRAKGREKKMMARCRPNERKVNREGGLREGEREINSEQLRSREGHRNGGRVQRKGNKEKAKCKK